MKDALPITPSITIFGNPYKILNAKGQLMRGTNCRGGPPWPPQVCHIVFQRRGGHGGPPLQLVPRLGGDDGGELSGEHEAQGAKQTRVVAEG